MLQVLGLKKFVLKFVPLMFCTIAGLKLTTIIMYFSPKYVTFHEMT